MKLITFLAILMRSAIAVAAVPIDGLYTEIFGGYAYIPSNVNQSYYGYNVNSPSYQGGYEAGGGIGYKSNPMRYEAEVTYLKANIRNFYLNYAQQTKPTGFSQAVLGFANIYLDIPLLDPILQPYFGGGIGYGWLQGTLNSTGPLIPVAFRAENSTFAYQGVAGITFNFSENYALLLSYRYVGTANSLSSFGKVFQVQMANAGAVYRFDGKKYK